MGGWAPLGWDGKYDTAIYDFDPMHRIEHAWIVVVKFEHVNINRNGVLWEVFFDYADKGYQDESVMVAICKAALKAKEEK